MIRARSKLNNQFLYIYQTYLQTNPENEVVWHYLCSENIDISKKYMHPILKAILDSDWELYNDIVEGDQESWLVFEKLLGHRP